MRSDEEVQNLGRLAIVLSLLVIILALTSCAALRTVPSGIPGCPNRTAWSDSAQRCIAREGR